MLLHLLPRHSLCCPHVLLTRCIQTLRGDAARTLHSPAEHFLRRRLPLRFHTQSRGAKSRSRKSKSQEEEWKTRNKTVLTYIAAAGVGMIGLSYAAVPLYRLYCQVGGTTPCSRCFVSSGCRCDHCVCVFCLSGVGARRHGGGGPRRGSSGDDEAGEGTCHQDHLQRRSTRQHAVELQTSADGDLCKTWFLLSTHLSPESLLSVSVCSDQVRILYTRPVLVLNWAGLICDLRCVRWCLLCRWFQVRRRWLSTEQRTPQINRSLASPPTTWSPLRRDSISTRSR